MMRQEQQQGKPEQLKTRDQKKKKRPGCQMNQSHMDYDCLMLSQDDVLLFLAVADVAVVVAAAVDAGRKKKEARL